MECLVFHVSSGYPEMTIGQLRSGTLNDGLEDKREAVAHIRETGNQPDFEPRMSRHHRLSACTGGLQEISLISPLR